MRAGATPVAPRNAVGAAAPSVGADAVVKAASAVVAVDPGAGVSSAATVASAVGQNSTSCDSCAPPRWSPGQVIGHLDVAIERVLDSATHWLSTLPANPITDFLQGALLLVRRILVPTGGAVGSSGSPACVATKNCSGQDLTGANLSWQDLTGVNFTGANMTRVDLGHSTLRGGSMSRTTLELAYMGSTDLSYGDLTGANLQEANLAKASLFRADLTGATLWDATLGGTSLQFTNLTKADLRTAKLEGQVNLLRTANLTGANWGCPRFVDIG